MTPNASIHDQARQDDFTALVMRVAAECALSDVVCIRYIAPAFTDDDGEVYPPHVVYECRSKRKLPNLTFDINAAMMSDVEDLIAMELEAVFG